MIAGLAAALALASAAPLAPASAAPVQAAADPIGDMIQSIGEKVSDAVNAVETRVKASLYHSGLKGLTSRDSLGCRLAPMRTVAVDPSIFPRHSILFIKETVGLKLPGGGVHDGYWYASDVGGAIKGARVDLFTGIGAASMKALQAINMTTISAVKVGMFQGCPADRSPVQMASNN